MSDKAIRAAKLTAAGILDKARARVAVDRAGGQIAPSKYLPDVPRQVHAAGGYVPTSFAQPPQQLVVARVARPVQQQQGPSTLDSLTQLAELAYGKPPEAKVESPSAATEGHSPEAVAAGMSARAQEAMNALRKGWTGQAFDIESAYRDPNQNQAVGGAKGSQHLHGNAYDIDTTGWTPEQKLALATEAYNAGFRGFGFYGNNLHFDVGAQRAWGPSYHRESIPDWAQPWTQQYLGYASGGKVAFQSGNHPLVPDVLYHGTARDIRSFDPDAKRSYDVDPSNPEETDTGWFGKGHYFTASPKLAAHYATEGAKRQGGEGANVIPVHVSMKNPFVVDMKTYDSGAKTLDAALSRAGVPMHPRGWRKPSEQTAALVAMGHDGVIATREGKPEEYVAFKPEQVKSALSARKFDPTSPDMTYAAGGAAMFEGIHPDLQDEQGKPKDLWHGTPNEPFDEFKDEKIGRRDPGFYGRGHYLTAQRGNAEAYADPEEMQRGSVMGPLHAALKNPFVWDASSPESLHRTMRKLQDFGVMGGKDRLDPWDALKPHEIDQFMKSAVANGHDGVIRKTGRGLSEIVAFKPSAIKHRDAERFDPNDPNIYHARGGVAK